MPEEQEEVNHTCQSCHRFENGQCFALPPVVAVTPAVVDPVQGYVSMQSTQSEHRPYVNALDPACTHYRANSNVVAY